MKITILSLFLLLVLSGISHSGISHSGIVVVPVEPASGEETNLERYRKYKGKSPLELWRQRHSKKHHSNKRIKQDIEPLNNLLFQETPIYHRPKKFHIKFQINH